MTVWYQLFNLLDRRPTLRTISLMIFSVVLITTLLFGHTATAIAGTNRTVNFQGRLMSAAGAVVADGNYNIQFKIYQDGAGNAAGNPGGSLQWTETYVNNGASNGIEVKNGFFSVSLGSLTPFGTSVNWDKEVLWLSMNVAGSAANCSTFGSSPCGDDGEMLSMKRITATPYAINSGSVGGKSADDLVQLGQGKQTDASNNSSININKTGTGNLVQLQAGGTDAFTVNNAGSISLGSASDQSIGVATAIVGSGKSLTVSAGGAAVGSNQTGGDLLLQGGTGDGAGTSGNVIVKAKDTDTTGTFQVQNTAGETVFAVDAQNHIVSAGSIRFAPAITTQSTTAISLWDNAPVSSPTYSDDTTPINLGVTFKSDQAGYVAGVKFYSPAASNSSGDDVGKLWACSSGTCALGGGGVELATVNFPVDATEGWKTARFSTPVLISPDTYYMVTYYSASGKYTAASHYFDTGYDATPLHISTTTRTGSYALNNATFPSATFNNTNYWVDVMFEKSETIDQISSSNELLITSAGAMTVGPASNSLKLQGSSIDIAASNGGNVTVQGGGATADNTDGGSLILSGGKGSGTGSDGLVVINTPTFTTTTDDANCYSGGVVVTTSCTISAASLRSSAVVIVGFSSDGQTATLPDPGQATAGRIMYVTAAGGSKNFTLRANVGDAAEQSITMRQNTTTTMLWNGSDWTAAGGSNSTTLQDAYSNSPQDASGATVDLTGTTGGLTLRDAASTPVDGALLAIKSATDSPLFSVTNKTIDAGTQTTTAANVAVGNGTGGGEATLFTVDKAAAAPTAASSEALLGSMYYDTTVGKLQCYEAKGWGNCGSSPDIFVAITPEYTNAVMNGNDIGTITSDLCSDALNINNGTSAQPTICGTNETYNFYKWNTAETTDQTRSIYVTYQLPATFDAFVAGSTSLMARTDSTQSTVSYQIYRDRGDAALVSCGSQQAASTGVKASWQKGTAAGAADPANCDFQAGDSILLRINLTAADNANAYVSNLGFVYSNN